MLLNGFFTVKKTYFFCSAFLLVWLSFAVTPALSEPNQAAKPSILKSITHPVASIDDARDFSDLTAFGEMVGDAKFVILGEQSFGEQNTALLRARLVRYLHQKKGFNAIALNSGLYDVAEIWQQAKQPVPINELGHGSLFYMYNGNSAVTGLFDYIDQHKGRPEQIELFGVDVQLTGLRSLHHLLPNLETWLEQHGKVLLSDPDWPIFQKQVGRLLMMELQDPPESEQHAFFRFTDKLTNLLEKLPEEKVTEPMNNSGFWLRVLFSLQNQAERYWQLRLYSEIGHAIGDNLLWYSDKVYPKHKIIVWIHADQSSKAGMFSPDGEYSKASNALPNLAAKIEAQYPGQVASVHFTANQGEYLSDMDLQKRSVSSAPHGTIEAELRKQNIGLSYMDLSRLSESRYDAMSIRIWYFNHRKPSPTLSSEWDILFYMPHVTPMVYQVNR